MTSSLPKALRKQHVEGKPPAKKQLADLSPPDSTGVPDGDVEEPRGRKQNRSSSPATFHRSRLTSSMSPSADGHQKSKWAPFLDEAVPTGKPKASDYKDSVKRWLLEAVAIYETYLFTKYTYPLQKEQNTWVKDAWHWAGKNLEVANEYELSDHMLCLIKEHGACAR